MKNSKLFTLAILFLASLTWIGCEQDSIDAASPGVSTSNTGTNSSYARMLTVGDFLYAINVSELVTFDVTDPSDPTEISRQDVGTGVETLFHYEGVLLIGSSEGTFTYTIESTGIPARRGQFDYNTLDLPVLPCDPVVASNDIAYATLYTIALGQGPCGRDAEVSLLVVMDISDLENPSLITSVQTPSPRGLAINGDHLYVCNEYAGLTVYDVSDPSDPTELGGINNILAYDVLFKDNKLIVVGGSQLLQYDAADPANLTLLGTISL